MEHNSKQSEYHSTTDRTDICLMNNSRVYAIADYYEIIDLKILASRKFAHAATSQSIYSFPNVIKEIYNSTPQTDTTLRTQIVKLALAQSKALTMDADFMTCISYQGDFARDFVQALVASHEEVMTTQISTATKLEQHQAEKLREASASATRLQGLLDSITQGMRKACAVVSKVKHCRYCGVDYNTQLDLVGNVDEPKVKLRCKSCQRRH